MTLIPLTDASSTQCGGKAATLAVLLREGLPVPDGFVVPFGSEQASTPKAGRALHAAVARELGRLGNPSVAVRSSAANEDTAGASAAGQYESVIGAQGAEEVREAIAVCWASARAGRVGDYWNRTATHALHCAPGMAVLVQRIVEADVSGVMFTPQQPGDPTRIEASWGLGLAVVGGTVTPDTFEAAPHGSIGFTLGSKQTSTDLNHEFGGIITSAATDEMQTARTLNDDAVATLTGLGNRVAEILDGPQDIEWAVADGTAWILQARPVTAVLPATRAHHAAVDAQALTGMPGAHGVARATARIVRGPSDFPAVQPGEVVICPYTDPAWTPLFTIAAGVVTETGGALSHAAIVAREYAIPAVIGVPDATSRIRNGDRIAIDGTAGTISIL